MSGILREVKEKIRGIKEKIKEEDNIDEENLDNYLFEESKKIIDEMNHQPNLENFESNNENVENIDGRLKRAIQWARDIANNNKIGYKYGGDGNGGYDCSHYVTAALKEGGFDVKVTGGGAMRKNLEKVGFTYMPYPGLKNLKPGDVVRELNRHVEFYAGNNKILGAHSDKDKKPGDSSGQEISERDASTSLKWRHPNYILRYTGEIMT